MATSQIATNMSAVRTHNVFSKNNANMSTALNRVSTGLKINSVQDGVSQYVISERMRARINANQQASQNVQNDTALANTASSGLDNTLSILKTLKARALDAANDSNSDDDRKTIQTEVDQLITQINDNVTTVKYNGKTLLDGGYGSSVLSSTKTVLNSEMIDTGTYSSTLANLGIVTGSMTGSLFISWTKNGGYNEDTSIVTLNSGTTLSTIMATVGSKVSASIMSIAANAEIAKDENGDPISRSGSGVYVVGSNAGVSNGFGDLQFTVVNNRSKSSTIFSFNELQQAKDQKTGTTTLNFQIGEEASDKIDFSIDNMSASALGIGGISGVGVTTVTGAKGAITAIDNAIKKVLDQQATIGAVENRLGYVADNLDTINENLQAADSTMRDADMSQEISNFMKYSVLSQSAQYMLAQSHQNAFQVLNLLQ